MMKQKKKQMKGKDTDTTGGEDEPAEKEETEFTRFKTYDDDGSNKKRRNKEDQKKEATRRKYEMNLKKENAKRYANSSYLTPESANYLNSLMNAQKKGGKVASVDQELIYAGLHQGSINKNKGKSVQKDKQKYKGRIKSSKKKNNRANRK